MVQKAKCEIAYIIFRIPVLLFSLIGVLATFCLLWRKWYFIVCWPTLSFETATSEKHEPTARQNCTTADVPMHVRARVSTRGLTKRHHPEVRGLNVHGRACICLSSSRGLRSFEQLVPTRRHPSPARQVAVRGAFVTAEQPKLVAVKEQQRALQRGSALPSTRRELQNRERGWGSGGGLRLEMTVQPRRVHQHETRAWTRRGSPGASSRSGCSRPAASGPHDRTSGRDVSSSFAASSSAPRLCADLGRQAVRSERRAAHRRSGAEAGGRGGANWAECWRFGVAQTTSPLPR